MPTFYSPLAAQDLVGVGESWVQRNEGSFLAPNFPIANVLGIREGRSSAHTYDLPALANSLAKGVGLRDWNPGDAHGQTSTINKVAVSFSTRHREGDIITRPAKRSAPHALMDLNQNIVPIQLSKAWQQRDLELITLMTNASVFGTAKTFSGTGALDTFAADQKPDVDINNNLMPMVKWRSLGFRLICVMSTHVMTILGRHPVYTGAGTGSAIAATLPRDEFRRRFLAAHPQVDDLILVDAVYDTARDGQTSAPRLIGNTVLWFGLVDARGSSFDLTSMDSMDRPDGAIILGQARPIEVVNWEDPGSEVEYFAARADFGWYFPRANDASAADFAHFYGASEIFTSNPT